MPPSFQSIERNHEFLIPLSISPEQAGNRDFHDFQVYARARQGVTREQVQAESETFSRALVQQFPAEHRDWRARLDRPASDAGLPGSGQKAAPGLLFADTP
jgi:hypothetical protein